MTALELYRAGKLTEAIAAALADVKAAATDRGRRWLLCQLLYFSGDLKRADQQLDTITQLGGENEETLQIHRHLIRGELARRQVFNEGRVPGSITGPDPQIQARLQALVLLRAGDAGAAAKALAESEEKRAPVTGSLLGMPFQDFRDLDDLTSSIFEVITADGEYQWLAGTVVKEITFHPPTRPFDLVWRRGMVTLQDGARGQMYFPALYPDSYADPRDEIKLGRMTDWVGDSPMVRGKGLRSLLIGDREIPFPDLLSITFNPPAVEVVA